MLWISNSVPLCPITPLFDKATRTFLEFSCQEGELKMCEWASGGLAHFLSDGLCKCLSFLSGVRLTHSSTGWDRSWYVQTPFQSQRFVCKQSLREANRQTQVVVSPLPSLNLHSLSRGTSKKKHVTRNNLCYVFFFCKGLQLGQSTWILRCGVDMETSIFFHLWATKLREHSQDTHVVITILVHFPFFQSAEPRPLPLP